MNFEHLPQPLQDWLLEPEGTHIRIERLYDELEVETRTYTPRLLDWLQAAYELGRSAPSGSASSSCLDP